MQDDNLETGLIGGRETRAVEIVHYDPRWPEIFRAHAAVIAKAVGAVAQQIEHIGSTSVPGLGAKPIVDMLLVVPDSADESAYLPQLIDAGYELRVREPELNEHRMLRTPGRDMHLHVYSVGSPEIERYITFRDRLRISPADRERYETTKRMLALREWGDMNDYAEAKTEVIQSILANN